MMMNPDRAKSGPAERTSFFRSRRGARALTLVRRSNHNSGSILHGLARRRMIQHSPFPMQSLQVNAPLRKWPIWLATVGIFLPNTVGVTGKYVVVPLFVLAVGRFVSNGSRRWLPCDFFIFATGLWMIVAELSTTGSLSMTTASDVFGFTATYMVARTFIYGEQSLQLFIQALKLTTVTLVAISTLDTLSGHFFINDAVSELISGAARPIVHGAGDIHRKLLGMDTIRATSTFDHPILFGSFCTFAAAIFLYSEQKLQLRAFYVGVCLTGVVLSISSAPLLGFGIAFSIYCCDQLLSQYPGRWKALWLALLGSVCALLLLSNRPLGFVFDHFTFTPETGYYRVLIWDNAMDYIARAPLFGDQSAFLADEILGNSVDCVWLVLALAYGLPVVLLLFLGILTACISGGQRNGDLLNLEMRRLRTGFSVVLAIFVFLGLTVHFWASIWLFWGLCIGIRASIAEYSRAVSKALYAT
jgi:hypothetical protein